MSAAASSGLAHALLAARAGLSVGVLDRDAQANGASVRNFGFITVKGQGQPDAWRRARRARDIWAELAVRAVETGRVETARGIFHTDRIVACPGTDLVTLFPGVFARRPTTLCKLHMLRLANAGWLLPAAVMSDLGLHHYRGDADCPSLPALRDRLAAGQAAQLDSGVHLIVVQSADGTLVVGDSHRSGATPDPFQPETVDTLIPMEFAHVLAPPPVVERWVSVYPSGPEDAFMEALAPGVRLVSVTSDTGAATASAWPRPATSARSGARRTRPGAPITAATYARPMCRRSSRCSNRRTSPPSRRTPR